MTSRYEKTRAMSTAARQTAVHPRAFSAPERSHGCEWLLDSVEIGRAHV